MEGRGAKLKAFGGDCLRAAGVVLAAGALGLATNAFSRHPVPVLDAQGPGMLAPQAERVKAEQVQRLLAQGGAGGLVLLDARSAGELRKGRPAGSWRVTLETFMDRYPEIRPFLSEARGIVVVCDSDQCPTGNLIVEWLGQMHYPGAKLLAGGWAAYEAAGLPVEATQP